MTIQQWLFSFKGRIGRRDFWISTGAAHLNWTTIMKHARPMAGMYAQKAGYPPGRTLAVNWSMNSIMAMKWPCSIKTIGKVILMP